MAHLRDQLVWGDGKFTEAFARCVVDRVGDSGGNSDESKLAKALCTERIDDLVVLLHKDRIDLCDVGVDGDMIDDLAGRGALHNSCYANQADLCIDFDLGKLGAVRDAYASG